MLIEARMTAIKSRGNNLSSCLVRVATDGGWSLRRLLVVLHRIFDQLMNIKLLLSGPVDAGLLLGISCGARHHQGTGNRLRHGTDCKLLLSQLLGRLLTLQFLLERLLVLQALLLLLLLPEQLLCSGLGRLDLLLFLDLVDEVGELLALVDLFKHLVVDVHLLHSLNRFFCR